MKTSELIKKLQSLLKTHGDKNLIFNVKDFYSIYGQEMTTNLRCGEETGLPSDWQSVYTMGNTTRIDFNLTKNLEGKNPKIIFRK